MLFNHPKKKNKTWKRKLFLAAQIHNKTCQRSTGPNKTSEGCWLSSLLFFHFLLYVDFHQQNTPPPPPARAAWQFSSTWLCMQLAFTLLHYLIQIHTDTHTFWGVGEFAGVCFRTSICECVLSFVCLFTSFTGKNARAHFGKQFMRFGWKLLGRANSKWFF